MNTYTADDFAQARFASRPEDYYARVAMRWPNSETPWRGPFGAWRDDQMADAGFSPVRECPNPDEHGPIDYRVLLEQAERERDEARARLAEAATEIRAQGETIAELVAENRPLTPDDAMLLRFMNTYDRLRDGSKDAPSLNHFTAARTSLTRSALTAALTVPQRPEGAEAEEDWLIEHLPHEYLTDDQIATVADLYASRGVRVEGFETPKNWA